MVGQPASVKDTCFRGIYIGVKPLCQDVKSSLMGIMHIHLNAYLVAFLLVFFPYGGFLMPTCLVLKTMISAFLHLKDEPSIFVTPKSFLALSMSDRHPPFPNKERAEKNSTLQLYFHRSIQTRQSNALSSLQSFEQKGISLRSYGLAFHSHPHWNILLKASTSC